VKAEELQLAFRDSRFVRGFFFYPSIESTNDRAKALAVQGVPEGTLVVADAQTAGRGREHRAWHSPPGLGIYVSFVFRPDLAVADAFGLLAVVSLAAAEAVDATLGDPAVTIKWPNDLFLGDRKLAGVLSELGTSGGRVDWSVVGIGINVNHGADDFPQELQEKATSLNLARGSAVNRVALLGDLVERAGSWYRRLAEEGTAHLLDAWRARSAVLGHAVRVETAGETYVGTAVAIENDGALRIKLEGGTEEVLHAGDVQLAQFR